jgi:hypothetical protein
MQTIHQRKYHKSACMNVHRLLPINRDNSAQASTNTHTHTLLKHTSSHLLLVSSHSLQNHARILARRYRSSSYAYALHTPVPAPVLGVRCSSRVAPSSWRIRTSSSTASSPAGRPTPPRRGTAPLMEPEAMVYKAGLKLPKLTYNNLLVHACLVS